MKLNAEVFEQIMRHVRSDDRMSHEHRTEARVGLTATASISLTAAMTPAREWPIRIRDLSRTGMGFLHHAPMRTGDHFVLRLPRHNAPPLMLTCEVTHCRSVAAGLWTVGARFGSPYRARQAG